MKRPAIRKTVGNQGTENGTVSTKSFFQFRRAAPAVLIVATAFFFVLMGFVSNTMFGEQADKMEETQFKLMATTLEFNVTNLEKRASLAAEAIANIATIRKLHSAGNRDALHNELQRSYEVLKEKYAVDQVQFHSLPAVSLLRMHAPTKFGDDLTETRPGVVTVNREKQAAAAPTMTRNGFAVFGIVPAYDDAGKHIGSFEVGILFKQMIARLKESFEFDSVVLVDGDIFKKTATAYADQNIYSDENRIGNFLNYRSTDWKTMSGVITPADLESLKNDTVTYSREAFGRTYGVVLFPLRNAAGVRIGILASALDISEPQTAKSMFTTIQITLTLLGIILTSGLIMIVIRGFLLGPLGQINQALEKLANGEKDIEPIDADPYCVEIQALNSHLDKLRETRE